MRLPHSKLYDNANDAYLSYMFVFIVFFLYTAIIFVVNKDFH